LLFADVDFDGYSFAGFRALQTLCGVLRELDERERSTRLTVCQAHVMPVDVLANIRVGVRSPLAFRVSPLLAVAEYLLRSPLRAPLLRFALLQTLFLADFSLFPGAGYPANLLACMAYERAVRVHYRVVPPQSGETSPRSGSVFRNYLATGGVEHTIPVTLVQALCLRHAYAQVVREFHYPFPVLHSTVLGADVHHVCYCCHVLKIFVD